MVESSMNRSFLLATVVAVSLGAGTAAQADSPRQFLRQALQGDNSEIMLGNLAAERARSPAVREFGRTLVSDHQQARGEVVDTGRRFGVWPNRQPTDEARALRDRLSGMQGRDFDREFVSAMIDDHRKDISEFRDEAREDHGAVSDLARNQLPTLRNHLRMAIALQRSNGRSSEGGWDMARDRGDRDNNGYRNDNGYRDNSRGQWER